MELIVFFSFVLLGMVNGCGMVTHSLIANRAITYYYKPEIPSYYNLIKEHIYTMSAGAPYPDYLYACGPDHNMGEITHWPPFQAAAANYIRSKPRPWDLETQKLVVFMMGVVSHYIADINWHGLAQVPHGYGFIETLGIMDFNCTGDLCGTAHSAADQGGEFCAAFQTNLDFLEPLKWYIPVQDLIKIYAQMNHTVSATSIDECIALFTAGSLAVKDLSPVVFPEETGKAPFLVERYIDFPLGGIDDMAVWSARMWNRMAKWIEEGPPNPPPPSEETPNRIQSSIMSSTKNMIKKFSKLVSPELINEWRSQTDIRGKQIVHEKIRNQIKMKLMETNTPESTTTTSTSTSTVPPKAQVVESQYEPMQSVNARIIANFSFNNPLEYLGSSLVNGDFDGDGKEDIVMGGYGHLETNQGTGQLGAIYVRFATGEICKIIGSNIYGRFGAAVATVDFNLDGVQDLVVSSPVAGWNWTSISVIPDFRYYGRVDVFYGARGRKSFPSQPNYSIVSNTQLQNFGEVLQTGDLNGDGHDDLIVGCPHARGSLPSEKPDAGDQRGLVFVYVSGSGRVTGKTILDTQSDLTLYGPVQFAWFGYSITVTKAYGNISRKLLIGAPGIRNNGITVGRLYGYDITSAGGPIKLTSVFTITGVHEKGKLGASVSAGKPVPDVGPMIALSSPTTNNKGLILSVDLAGSVNVFEYANLKGDLTLDQVHSHTVLYHGSYGARFGWTVLFRDVNNDGNDDLLIGAPLRTSLYIVKNQREDGQLTMYAGGSAFPRGNVEDCATKATWLLQGETIFSRLGWSFTTADIDGDNKLDVVVGSPMQTVQSVEMAGQVTVFSLQ